MHKPNKFSCGSENFSSPEILSWIDYVCGFGRSTTDMPSFIRICKVNWAERGIRHIHTSLKWDEIILKVTVLNYSERILSRKLVGNGVFAPFENQISLSHRHDQKSILSLIPYSIHISNRIEQCSIASDLSSLQWTENPVSHIRRTRNIVLFGFRKWHTINGKRDAAFNSGSSISFLYSLKIINFDIFFGGLHNKKTSI